MYWFLLDKNKKFKPWETTIPDSNLLNMMPRSFIAKIVCRYAKIKNHFQTAHANFAFNFKIFCPQFFKTEEI